MSVKTVYTSSDPRSFFYYKGDFYINGTEIILSDEYINTHKWNGKKLWKYARYERQGNYNGIPGYLFNIYNYGCLSRQEQDKYAFDIFISTYDIDCAIEGFKRPIKLERAQTEVVLNAISTPKSEFDNPGVAILWLIYIIAMFGSLIFNQFYILWIIITVVFATFRREFLNR